MTDEQDVGQVIVTLTPDIGVQVEIKNLNSMLVAGIAQQLTWTAEGMYKTEMMQSASQSSKMPQITRAHGMPRDLKRND